MTLLRSLLAELLALLRLSPRPRVATRRNPTHIPISSFQRRYPGRTPAAELRRNLGWIAVMAARSHRDRRA